MKPLAARDLQPEIMDDFALDRELHEKALQGLARLNAASFAAGSLLQPLKNYWRASGKKTLRILDVACGGGDILRALEKKSRGENLPFVFEGCDINTHAVDFARRQSETIHSPVEYFTMDALEEPIPPRFDAVISSLFIHHLADEQVVRFFENVRTSQAGFMAVADLERSFSGWLLVWLATRLLSRSPVVHYDGPQSVRAAFTQYEITQLASKAGLTETKIWPVWPRYLLTWRRP